MHGLRVVVSARPAQAGATFTSFSTVALTAIDGSFSVSGVPDGVYAMCPHIPNLSTLPPCSWGSEPTVTVSGGQTVSAAPIQLQAGTDFYVRVNDPNGTRKAAEGKVPGAAVIFAVRTSGGRFIPIPVTATDPAGFDQHLAVPTGVDLVFVAYSNYYTMTDDSSAAIDKSTGKTLIVNVPSGQAQYQKIINIQ